MSKDVYELFTDALAHAIAEGRKTVTRRPIIARNSRVHAGRHELTGGKAALSIAEAWFHDDAEVVGGILVLAPRKAGMPDISATPRAEPGDTLIVRETFRPLDPAALGPSEVMLRYSDRTCRTFESSTGRAWVDADPKRLRNFPNIHMPRWAARSTPRIVSVTPERVCLLSQAEAELEGFDSPEEFAAVWEPLYPDDRWCWRMQFEGPKS